MHNIKLGEKIPVCNCFFKDQKEHPTQIDTEGNCLYCGYYSLEMEVTTAFLKRHNKRKTFYDSTSHKIFQKRMECIIEGREYYDIMNEMNEDEQEEE